MKIRLLTIALMAAIVGLGACSGGDDKSSEKKMLTFTVKGVAYQLNEANHTFTYSYDKIGAGQWESSMPNGPEIPQITISDKATINPPASTPQDFVGNTITYTVTAEDGTTQDYKVIADKQLE